MVSFHTSKLLGRGAVGCGVLVLLFFFLVIVVGFSKGFTNIRPESAADTTWRTYTHTGLGFSFEYPADYIYSDILSTQSGATISDMGITAATPTLADCPADTLSIENGDCYFWADFYANDFRVSWNGGDEVTTGTPVTVNGHEARMVTGTETGDLYWKKYVSYVFRYHGGNLVFRFYTKNPSVLQRHIVESVQFK